MIAGRWGKPSEVLLDLVVEEDGAVSGSFGWRNVRMLINR